MSREILAILSRKECKEDREVDGDGGKAGPAVFQEYSGL